MEIAERPVMDVVPFVDRDIMSQRRESAASTSSVDSDYMPHSNIVLRIERPESSTDGEGVCTKISNKHLSAVSDSACESSASDCRDSGVEIDQFTPPDEETARQIAEQVEYYFSDENLLKDAFLLKHVKRNKEGFVSLKLIASFKRVKHLTKDWRAVAYSTRFSNLLENNDNGSKVRRLQPLPEHDETITSRTVVAVNLPMENPTIANVSDLFAECGEILSIRVLRPGSNIPPEVRAAFNKYPDIQVSDVNCAVVEFEKQEHAKKAKEEMGSDSPEDTGAMHVIPIGKVSKKKSKQEDPKLFVKTDEEENVNRGVDETQQKKRRQRRKKVPLVHTDSHSSMSGTDVDEKHSRRFSPPSFSPLIGSIPIPIPPGSRVKRMSPPSRSSTPLSPLAAPFVPSFALAPALTAGPIRGDHLQHLGVRGKSNSCSNVIPSAANSLTQRQKKSNSFSGIPCGTGQSPWVARRKASGLSDADRRGSLMQQDCVIREPRGPDGTKGFGAHLRSRAFTMPAAITATAPTTTVDK